MFERLKSMLVKEFIQVLRDPRMRFVIFLIPVFVWLALQRFGPPDTEAMR